MVRRGGDPREPEPSSWGESLNMYTTSKTTRPCPDSAYVKPERITRYEKSRQEVEYHPILQTFTAPGREAVAAASESRGRIDQLNAARDRQIATESQYDLLNMTDKRSGLEQLPQPAAQAMQAKRVNPHAEKPTFKHPLDSCYKYNIISNHSLQDHHYSAPALRPRADSEADSAKPRFQHTASLPRDFNILSNRYVEQHEDKVKLEREIQRRTAASKFWETHDYEPLLGVYIQPDKEKSFQEAMSAQEAKQPMKSFNRLPPSLQKGEGFVYDITTHRVKNSDLYEAEQTKQDERIERNAKTWNRAEQARNKGLERQVVDEARVVNRQSHTRYVESYRHGYNIIDHRDYRDPQTYIPPPRKAPPPTLWQAVGPDRPPPPPPLPAPPPPVAPLLSTMPPGSWGRASGSMRGGESQGAPPTALSSTVGSTGLGALARGEQMSGALSNTSRSVRSVASYHSGRSNALDGMGFDMGAAAPIS